MKYIENFIKIIPKYRVKKEDKKPTKRNNKKKTTEQYKQELHNINPNIEVLEEYINNKTKILHLCKTCNHKWKSYPSNILKGSDCPKCYHTNRIKTNDEFVKEMYEKHPNIEILSEYIKASEKISCRCKICGYIWSATARSLSHGTGCMQCGYESMKKKVRKSHQIFVEELQEINSNIILLEEYINNYTKIKVKCKICNHEWNPFPTGLLSGHGCPECSRYNIMLSENEFFDRINFCSNNTIIIHNSYNGLLLDYVCECKKCGNIWETKGAHLIRGHACPKCKSSRGERIICSILDNHKIEYYFQKSFYELKGVGNKPLSYDFYIPKYNLLIEFQGIQHDITNDFFGGEKQFKIQQEHDKRKREYAKQNNINLLEIWYYDIDNIESILLQKINEIKENNLKLESVETVIPA